MFSIASISVTTVLAVFLLGFSYKNSDTRLLIAFIIPYYALLFMVRQAANCIMIITVAFLISYPFSLLFEQPSSQLVKLVTTSSSSKSTNNENDIKTISQSQNADDTSQLRNGDQTVTSQS